MNVTKFDTDDEALEWARERVQFALKRLREMEKYARLDLKNPERAAGYGIAANTVEHDLIGGEGCVIAAFDRRMPTIATAMAST